MQMNLGGPSPRAATGMAAVGKHLVIFGGKDAEARKNDLYIFDTGVLRIHVVYCNAWCHDREPGVS